MTRQQSCFNPCFVGNRSGSLGISAVELRKECFNPCFVGNRSGRYLYLIVNFSFPSRFNPCFVGNRSGRSKSYTQTQHEISFNPCFVGNRSGSSNLFQH